MRYPYAPGSVTAHARSVAELGGGAPPVGAPAPVILRRGQPYDLSTPGTPQGIIAVARAAEQGAPLPPPGGWSHRATFALAQTPDGTEVIASLCLRLVGDVMPAPLKSAHSCRRCGRWLEGEWSGASPAERVEIQRQMDGGRCDGCARKEARPRRAWVAYVRDEGGGWRPNGAALLDPADAERPMRVIGIEELKATLRGEVWIPPVREPPSPPLTVPCPDCGQPARLTSAGKIYANHKCTTAGTTEGRS